LPRALPHAIEKKPFMPTIAPRNRNDVDPATATILNQVQAKLGSVPNMFLTLANSPVALNAYVKLADIAASGKLSAKQREQIALTVGEGNQCGYCVAAHSVIGKMVGLNQGEITQARSASSVDAKTQAALTLAAQIVERRGHISATELASFKAAGFAEADVLEVLVNVVLNIFTNYTNHIAGTEVDFPLPEKLAA
jgi:uncharacterized peroxidase-related enzyme